jgi:IS30 family transposase
MDENPVEVIAIRRLWFKSDHSTEQIARMVGVSTEYVYSVVRAETHYHPPYNPEQTYPSRSKRARQQGTSSKNQSMLTMEEASTIRQLWAGDQHTAQAIADLYSLSKGMVYKIVHNRVKALYDATYKPPRSKQRGRRPRTTYPLENDNITNSD